MSNAQVPPSPFPGSTAVNRIRRSPITQAIIVGILILGLQIPVLFISWLVSDRERTRNEAIDGVTASWGREQTVLGPYLVVPTYVWENELANDGRRIRVPIRRTTIFLPKTLDIQTSLKAETRERGIFEAPVYESTLQITGSFELPEKAEPEGLPSPMRWDESQIVFEFGDAHAIQKAASLHWGESDFEFEPGTGELEAERPGIHTAVTDIRGQRSVAFSTTIALHGSLSMTFAPLGEQTEVSVEGNWPDPSFQGAWLPNSSDVQRSGFTATWSIPYLGRDYPQSWQGDPYRAQIQASLFGVDLLSPVDAYRQTERSLKYQILFLGLTLMTIWLFEILAGVRLHFIQYGLIGASLCLFYLLELSLAEHIGFGLAYALAASGVVLQVFAYSASVMRSVSRGAVLGVVAASLYGCLFVLIRLQDFALLVGSLGLFVILALIMFLTRKVDWFAARIGDPSAPRPEVQ